MSDMEDKNKTTGNRYVFIDYTRVLAIFCVVLCHTVVVVYSRDTDALGALSNQANFFRICVFTLGRSFGVPFFLMISGFLLLDKFYDTSKIRRFYINNWGHIIACTVIWFALYYIYAFIILNSEASLTGLLKEMLLLKQPTLSHQWYLPMIIGYYAMLPFVANALYNSDSLRALFIPYLMVFVYGSLVLSANMLLDLLGKESLSPQIEMGFTGGVYGLYIITGFLIKKGMLKRIKTTIILFIAAVSISMQVVFVFRYYSTDYIVWYDSPLVIIASIAVFELTARTEKMKANRFVTFLARNAFAVYLLHMMIRDIPFIRQSLSGLNKASQTLILTVIIMVVSYALAWLMGKTKIGRYMLYIK